MIHNVASLISRVLHPLLMPAYLFICLGYFYPSTLNNPGKNTFVLVSFMFTITTALPLINLMLLRSMGIFEKFSQNKHLERIIPITAVTIIYLVVIWLFYFHFYVPYLIKFLIIIAANALAGSLLSVWKNKIISIPALAAGANATLLVMIHNTGVGVSMAPPVVAILCCGLVMSVQLYLQRNRPSEVYLGLLAGCLTTFFAATYFL